MMKNQHRYDEISAENICISTLGAKAAFCGSLRRVNKTNLALVQFMVLDSQTPETPNIPNFENIGSPGVQTPETPKTLKMLRQLGVSGVWTPGLPIPLKYGILGVSGVWESGLPKPSILVVLGVQESNQLTIA